MPARLPLAALALCLASSLLLAQVPGVPERPLPDKPFLIDTAEAGQVRVTPMKGLELPWDLDTRATTRVLLTTVTVPHFDHALADWLGGTLRPTVRAGDEQTAVYRQLVTVPSEAVRGCFVGDIARCKDVLQLGDSTGVLGRWYVTPTEREALVSGVFGDYFARGGTAPSLQKCRQHRDDACTALLQSLPPGTVPRLLATAARLSLVREALRAGGRDAYSRLVAHPEASIDTRLASAARMDIDSLVARWRNAVLAARPVSLALPWWAGIAAIGWTAFFGFCALRSSRWRL